MPAPRRRLVSAFTLLVLAGCGPEPPANFLEFVDLAAIGDPGRVAAGLAAHPGWATERNAAGQTALHGAAFMGRLDCVGLLLAAGADLEAADIERNRRPLHEAAAGGRNDVVALLLSKGATVDARTEDGRTPLHECVWASDAQRDVVRTLVEKGADVNAVSSRGFSPVLLAAIQGHAETLALLLEKGARVDLAAEDGRTPLSAARDGGHAEVVQILERAGAK
jgi:ankyrin